jgi:large subunit ribosomal protein L5
MTHLEEQYKSELANSLKKDLGVSSMMEVPRLEKIVVSVSTSEAVKNPKILNSIADEVTTITGQKAVITKAKKAIANFKLREGMPLGVRVTLRRERMWTFLERFVNFSVPAVRDFRGLPKNGFDGRGNYNMGLKEQLIFPEISYDRVDKVRGMNITFCTSAKTDAQGKALLDALGLPFQK